MSTPQHELTFSQLTKLNCTGGFVQSTNGELLYPSCRVRVLKTYSHNFKVACFLEHL